VVLRYSAGASVLGSNVSTWVGPPPSQSQTTEVLRDDVPAVAAAALPFALPVWWDPSRMDLYFPGSLDPIPPRYLEVAARLAGDHHAVLAGDPYAEGWAAGLVLILEQAKVTGSMAGPPDSSTPKLVFDYLAGEIFQKSDARTQAFLLNTAFLPQMTTRIAEELTIDGFVYRFCPGDVPRLKALPMGELEGAFLPCTFWLATVRAMQGRAAEAEAIVRRAEAVAGPLGLFAEAVDPRTRSFLGNGPLLFSQVEYVRAVQELEARGSSLAA